MKVLVKRMFKVIDSEKQAEQTGEMAAWTRHRSGGLKEGEQQIKIRIND